MPDLVVLTGDVLSRPKAGPSVLRALEPLLGRPGIFVPGNNDYYEPHSEEPGALLRRHAIGAQGEARSTGPASPGIWPAAGWQDLTNARVDLKVAGRVIDVRGVDDPYSRRDRPGRRQRPGRSPGATCGWASRPRP